MAQISWRCFLQGSAKLYLCSKLTSPMIHKPVSQAMKSKIGLLILILALWSVAPAQTTKRRGAVRKPTVTTPTTPQPVAQPTPASKPARPPAAPAPLVSVNGQTFTTADLEPALRQELESQVRLAAGQ